MEKVQKLSNPEDYHLWYVKTKWQDITQTMQTHDDFSPFFNEFLIRYTHIGGKKINISFIIISS
jgi:hypothetical protein